MTVHKLFLPIEKILNLNKSKISALYRLNIKTGIDLLLHIPVKYRKYKIFPSIMGIKEEDNVYLKVKIDEILVPSKKSSPVKIYASNETGSITLIYFKFHDFLKNYIKVGKTITFSGKVEFFDYRAQISHPEIIYGGIISDLEAIYPRTYALTNNQIRSYILDVISNLQGIKFSVIDDYLKSQNLPIIRDAFFKIHSIGNSHLDLKESVKSLKYFEAFSNQLGFKMLRFESCKNPGSSFFANKELQDKILLKLGFNLTIGQKSALRDIEKDQESSAQMLRMIQGDVGCGKTLVALLSSINVTSFNAQVAIMAPTEVLAVQHYENFQKILSGFGISAELINAKIKGKKRNEILKRLEDGDIDIIIGTHSLIQEKIKFKNLRYIVVDEQHKFGVAQRLELMSKGNNPDMLVMSATPIPRTLSLTMFGDLAISKIETKPESRKPIDTYVIPSSKIEDLTDSLKTVIDKGEKIFWVCPLIQQNETEENVDIIYTDVETRFEYLKKQYGDKVGILHGSMNMDEKSDAINALKNTQTQILVSTTVIEVGIDIPDATLIVIENAEKFGLAQLHQLRGRVGRGSIKSSCILIYGSRTSKIAFQRLKILKESNDGFYIADQDLKLRGEGELLGSRQSGEQNFIFLSVYEDSDIISKCNELSEETNIGQSENLVISFFNQQLYNNKIIA
jgi:ATP-dependent DNA helicase RecG